MASYIPIGVGKQEGDSLTALSVVMPKVKLVHLLQRGIFSFALLSSKMLGEEVGRKPNVLTFDHGPKRKPGANIYYLSDRRSISILLLLPPSFISFLGQERIRTLIYLSLLYFLFSWRR